MIWGIWGYPYFSKPPYILQGHTDLAIHCTPLRNQDRTSIYMYYLYDYIILFIYIYTYGDGSQPNVLEFTNLQGFWHMFIVCLHPQAEESNTTTAQSVLGIQNNRDHHCMTFVPTVTVDSYSDDHQ